MKFVISSTELSTHLLTLGRVIAQKNNMAILNCFCFDISGDTLKITASDNDSTLITHLHLIECDEDTRFAVNAKTLQDAIKEIPEQPLDIFVNTDTFEITIIYQNGQFKLMGQSAEEYPDPVVGQEQPVTLTVTSEHLLAGLSRGMIAAAVDTARPQLNAVCFDLKDGHLAMVATNGNQLALTSVNATASSDGCYLLPMRPCTLLKGILGKTDNEVKVELCSRNATFRTGDYMLMCRLVEGRYPNYRSVIPQNNPISFTVNRLGFISVLRRVLICANAQAVLVKLRLENNSIVVTSQDMDFGKSAEETILCDYASQPMQIAFRGDSLSNMLNNLEAEDITFKVSDPSRAALIVPTEAKEGEDVLMLIMPSVFSH